MVEHTPDERLEERERFLRFSVRFVESQRVETFLNNQPDRYDLARFRFNLGIFEGIHLTAGEVQSPH